MSARYLAIVVGMMGLCIGWQAAGQTPAPAASSKPDPQLTTEQNNALDKLGAFLDSVDQRIPGDASPAAPRLSEVMRTWAREVRTIRVQVGVTLVPRAYPAGVTEGKFENVKVNRLSFGPFTKADEGGTSGEYDPEFGTLKLNETMVPLLNDTSSVPRYGTHNISRLTANMERAQTVVHEFFHSTQGPDAGSTANEAKAWLMTLQTTGTWVTRFENAYNASRTLDNARSLWAAIDAWSNYYKSMQDKIHDKEIDSIGMPDQEKQRLEGVLKQVKADHSAIEILEQLAGPPAIPGTARTLDQLLQSVQATSLSDLDSQLFAAARAQIDRGMYRNHTAAQKDRYAKDAVASASPIVQAHWQKGVQAVAVAAQKLKPFVLQVSTKQNKLAINSQSGAADLVVAIDNEAEYKQLVADLAQALKRACGSKGTCQAVNDWTVTDFATAPESWPAAATRTFPLVKPQKYDIELSRTLQMGVDLSAHGVPKTLSTKSNKLTVEVIPAFPSQQELAGNWTGSLTIVESPYLDALAAAPPASQDGKPSEACQLFTVQFGPAIKALKGNPLHLSVHIAPQSETAGILTLAITAPAELGGKAGEPQRYPYTYAGGVLSINTAAQQDLRIVMDAQFTLVKPGEWSFRGTWNGAAELKGRSVPVMSGVWSAHKP